MPEDVKDIKFLIEDYYKWLKDKTTPYLDRHNDYVLRRWLKKYYLTLLLLCT